MPVDERRPRRWKKLFTAFFSFLRWLISMEQLPEPCESASPVPSSSPGFVRWLWSSDKLPQLEAHKGRNPMSTLHVLMCRDTLPEPQAYDPVMTQHGPLRHFFRQESLPEPQAKDLAITRGGLLRHFFRRETLDASKKEAPHGA